ncbi:MAG TPA: hypothetical protein VFX12_04030 [Vicinamibacterales bacterium]|nr:hypothetical protein [Vicinamibacterales bacterium]
MSCRRGGAAAALLVAATLACGSTASAQDRPEASQTAPAHQSPASEQAVVEALMKVADVAMAGRPSPSDIPLHFRCDFLKAQEKRTYVPYIVSLDAATLASPSVVFYLRVVARGTAGPDGTRDAKHAGGDKPGRAKAEKMPATFAYEDVQFVEVAPPPPGEPARISRAFAVPAGEYDVYLVLRDRATAGAPPRTSVLVAPITVPDFWTGELTTSSIMLADRVERLSAPLTKDQQIEHPFALGQAEIEIAADSSFSTRDELSVVFLIYNPTVAAGGKFDLQVDYAFYRETAEGEQYFNRTEPQRFNPSVLGPAFDPSAGQQIVAGQAVPLAAFEAGNYRLDIKVTDLISGKSLARDVTFTVTRPIGR